MSAIVSTGRGSRSGTGADSPARTARVPAANPVRSIGCAKIVKASWPEGSTITSKVSATAMRNSSTATGRTGKPSAATTVIFSPGIRTSKYDIPEPLMKRSRTFSPGVNSPVQLPAGARPFIR